MSQETLCKCYTLRGLGRLKAAPTYCLGRLKAAPTYWRAAPTSWRRPMRT